MRPILLPLIITLSLAACSNLNPSSEYLRNPAVDAKYTWTYKSDTEPDRKPDQGTTGPNLLHAGYRFVWAVGNAQKYRDVVPLDLEQSVKDWMKLVAEQTEALNAAAKDQKPQQQALLDESKRNLELVTGLKQRLASTGATNVLAGGGLLLTPRYQALKEMWQSGISFADLSCAEFFDAASRQQTSRDFLAKEVQLLAGLTSAVQGVTGVSAKVISATASSFSFGQSAMQAYETTMALAPDIYLLQKAVQVKKRSQRKQLDTPELFAGSYYDVEQALLAYAEPCTFGGLKGIINEALQEKNQKDNAAE